MKLKKLVAMHKYAYGGKPKRIYRRCGCTDYHQRVNRKCIQDLFYHFLLSTLWMHRLFTTMVCQWPLLILLKSGTYVHIS